MAKISPHIRLYTKEKAEAVNPKTLELWKKYKIDMSLRGLSERSVEGYTGDLFQWFIYILDNQGNIPITEITDDDLTEFFYFCKTNGNNSRRIRRRMSSISAFYIFLRKKKLIKENPMEFIDRPQRDTDIIVQTYLTKEQVKEMSDKLQELIDSSTTVKQVDYNTSLKLYALFSLSTMARITAVSSIRWEQIDWDGKMAIGVLEKEAKIVDLSFSSEVKELLHQVKEHRETNNVDDAGYVFYSGYGGESKQITTETLGQWCKRIGEMISVPTLHAHDFRHSNASLLKAAGMSLEEVSSLLSHSGTDVTKKHYIKEDTSKLRESKDKFEAMLYG